MVGDHSWWEANPTLPAAFLARMEQLLGTDFPAFLQTYDQPKSQALRLNLMKGWTELPLHGSAGLHPVPWAPGGLYYDEPLRPGRHPYHAAGLYYIQEPSAMAVAPILDPQPGERVLDLCAAPGGKSTQLGALMQNQGLLITNEIHPKRVRILMENVERMGLSQAVVLNERPDRLAKKFPAFFDRILVDAPCSGEGMFRKLPEARQEWRPDSPAACSLVQKEILQDAVRMLRPGGRLVYSTCTFAPEENEQVLLHLLEQHPEMRLLELPAIPGLAPAQPDWTEQPERARDLGIQKAGRLWPHRLQGEGHFVALLEKAADAPSFEAIRGAAEESVRAGRERTRSPRGQQKERTDAPLPPGARAAFERFCQESLTSREGLEGPLLLHGDWLYLLPTADLDLTGLRVIRAGLQLGELKKGRFEPAHHLALALQPAQAQQRAELAPDSPELFAYLRGETLPAQGQSGWTLVTTNGLPLGWAKAADGVLKNHYPKGLRWLSNQQPQPTEE